MKKVTHLGRFHCVVTKEGCHECISHKSKIDGRYYSVKYEGKNYLLHRLIYENLKVNIPYGMIVRHTCDNVLCINPDHLIHGTNEENVADAVERDRVKFGEENSFSKLTEKQAIEILNSTENKWELAKRYGVHERTIRNIRSRRYWKRL